MESIIAGQKIGKRRRDPRPRRALKTTAGPSRIAGDYSLWAGDADNRIGRESAAGRSPRQKRASAGLGLFPKLARLASRLGGALGAVFHAKLRRRGRPAQKPGINKKANILGGALVAAAAVAALFALLSRGPSFPVPASGMLPADASAEAILLDYVSPELTDGRADATQDVSSLPPAPPTLEMSSYTVRAGDSLASISKRFGLYMDTLISANGISSVSSVKPGTVLRVPNINGLVQRVRAGDSLASIAKRYKTDATRIVDANDLGSARLVAGQSIFIPGARLPDSAVKQALGPKVAWPVRGPLSSFFGYRPDPFTGVRRFHAGLDIVVDAGTVVHAAMDGTVADVGYNGNYGNYVILSHSDGYQTLYGHLTSYSVAVGAKVAQGDPIALSGNTGYSTGAHLHFGLFRRSLALNPLKYLK